MKKLGLYCIYPPPHNWQKSLMSSPERNIISVVLLRLSSSKNTKTKTEKDPKKDNSCNPLFDKTYKLPSSATNSATSSAPSKPIDIPWKSKTQREYVVVQRKNHGNLVFILKQILD